jgi:hypothetical protein
LDLEASLMRDSSNMAALLAATMLFTLALPQWSMMSSAFSGGSRQGTIVVAQTEGDRQAQPQQKQQPQPPAQLKQQPAQPKPPPQLGSQPPGPGPQPAQPGQPQPQHYPRPH